MTGSAGPRFRQIARALREGIESGTLAVGAFLPTEAELSSRYGVSRHTVREALSELRSQGLIESRRGRGSVVVQRTARTVYAEVHSSIEDLVQFAKDTPMRVYGTEEVIADPVLAARLRGRPGRSYLRVLGVRGGDHGAPPAGHVEVYVDGTYAGIQHHLHDLQHSLAQTIEDVYGLRISRIEQEIAADVLDEESASRVGASEGSPALLIRRWYASDDGRIFEVAFSRYPVGRFTYRNVLLRRPPR